MSAANVHAFIKKLKDDAFFAQLAPLLSNIGEGDWQTVSNIASQYGFQFTANEIKAEMTLLNGTTNRGKYTFPKRCALFTKVLEVEFKHLAK